MGIYYLKLTADLSNVTDLQPLDDATSPYEYVFSVECVNCRETHSKPVSINRFESYDHGDSRGVSNFVFKCKSCKKEGSANIERTVLKYTLEDSGKSVALLQIDSRGFELKDFVADGKFQCKGVESGTVFDEVDLSDHEWYDYDDKASQEVSVENVKWDILRS